ncbi:MAG TPA: DUF4166 domain-containing protein [Stellaceae bacterium]|jgi:hypothetical protein|nr:DUF4166 domain-containing protein [Stellaceae bacterium]
MTSPFEALLGHNFDRLPPPVQRLHGLSRDTEYAGRADVTVAPNPVARLICLLSGLPQSGTDVPVTVAYRIDERRGETWQRRFAGRRYASRFSFGRLAGEDLLTERFVPFRLYHRVAASRGGLTWRLVAWRIFGIPLPNWARPDVRCFESADGERFMFDIDIALPLIGAIVHYRGWLLPQG